ncbi:MAG: 3-methyl-2-oxobutanoate dehydrogenase (2-methylpropanoyl-transferring) subunit alpha, partial [Pseudomonadota bacterium]|nr:3-methyl-2-oxobutanoate dehydrogenase (2-methylpropanoyl-transferring) subunit alpha [Pseudomonadota bacterium]
MADRPEGSAAQGDNRPKLSLHVPEPKFRPGDTVDFSHIEVPAAGSAPRPDEACDPAEMHNLAFGLVRVLGDDDKAHGPWDPKLDPDTLRKMLGHMAMTRAFDERMFRGQRQGKTSFYMKCTG